jgi:hypothetical protein
MMENTFIFTYRPTIFMRSLQLRKMQREGRVSVRTFLGEDSIGIGDYLIVEKNTNGSVTLFPARIEKKPLCTKN